MDNAPVLTEDVAFGECPRWSIAEQRLTICDQHLGRLARISMTGESETIVSLAGGHGAARGNGRLKDGSYICMVNARYLMTAPAKAVGATFETAHEIPLDIVANKDGKPFSGPFCNDMCVDARGGAYCCQNSIKQIFTSSTIDRIFYYTPDGKLEVATDDVEFPNGTVITPDGKTLITGQTWSESFVAFDRDPATGKLSNKRTWATLGFGMAPDGCCLDAEGCIWFAAFYSAIVPVVGEVLQPSTTLQRYLLKPYRQAGYLGLNQGAFKGFVRIAEGGLVKQAIPCVPGETALACVLGGPSLTTLFMVCSRVPVGSADFKPADGCVRTAEVGVGAAVMPGEKRYCAGYC